MAGEDLHGGGRFDDGDDECSGDNGRKRMRTTTQRCTYTQFHHDLAFSHIPTPKFYLELVMMLGWGMAVASNNDKTVLCQLCSTDLALIYYVLPFLFF